MLKQRGSSDRGSGQWPRRDTRCLHAGSVNKGGGVYWENCACGGASRLTVKCVAGDEGGCRQAGGQGNL